MNVWSEGTAKAQAILPAICCLDRSDSMNDHDAIGVLNRELRPDASVLMDAKAGPTSNCKPDTRDKYNVARTLPSFPAPTDYSGTDVAV